MPYTNLWAISFRTCEQSLIVLIVINWDYSVTMGQINLIVENYGASNCSALNFVDEQKCVSSIHIKATNIWNWTYFQIWLCCQIFLVVACGHENRSLKLFLFDRLLGFIVLLSNKFLLVAFFFLFNLNLNLLKLGVFDLDSTNKSVK